MTQTRMRPALAALFALGAIAGGLGAARSAPGFTAPAAKDPMRTARPVHFVRRGPGKRNVSIVVDHAPIRAVLQLLFRRGNQSYVLGPHVGGYATASLQDVPFDTALDQIMAVNSVRLTRSMRGGVYVIRGHPKIARQAPARRPATPAALPVTTPPVAAAPRRPIYRPPATRPFLRRPLAPPGFYGNGNGNVRVVP